MHLADLVAVYRAKTDEELVQLAKERDALTEEARHALTAEMAVRRIKAEMYDESEQCRNRQASGPLDAAQSGQHFRTSCFIKEVLHLYNRSPWLFMKLVFPAVVIGTIAFIATRYEIREIERHIPHTFAFLLPPTKLFELIALTWSRNLVTWLAFCGSFAAVSVATEEIAAGFEADVEGSFKLVVQKISPLLWSSLLLFALMLAIEGGILLVLLPTGISEYLGRDHPVLGWIVSYVASGLGLLLLSRFSLAIPAVILDDCRVGQAMFRSDELTKGKWGVLALLLFKSIVGGYIAGMLPFWLARLLPSSIPLPPGFSWILTAASVSAVCVVEPIMFIGFALLYVKTTAVSAPVSLKVASAV